MQYVDILESFDSLHFYSVSPTTFGAAGKAQCWRVPHTSKYGPWRIKTYVCVQRRDEGRCFEKYRKSASGRAFAKKRL